MSCIEIALRITRHDTNGQNNRLFMPRERYPFNGVPVEITSFCACSGGFTVKTYFEIQVGVLTYQIPEAAGRVVDCQDEPATLDAYDRMAEINSIPVDPVSNTRVPLDAPDEDNRNDAHQLKRFNQMARFDLRRRSR